MSIVKPTGGPAFPFVEEFRRYEDHDHRVSYEAIEPHEGMTLRDWFAGQALMMMSAQTNAHLLAGEDTKTCAAWAYEVADMMLAERDK